MEGKPSSAAGSRKNVRTAEKNATEARHAAARIVNNNFRAGRDCLVTLTYSPEGIAELVMKAGTDDPDAIKAAAAHEMELCIRRARRACDKAGVELKRMVFDADLDGKTLEPVQVHHHVIVNRAAAKILQEAWHHGLTLEKKLYSAHHGDLTDLVEYLMAQVRQIGTEKRYSPSRNLEAPIATKPRLAKNPEAELRFPKGCQPIWRAEGHAGRPQRIRYKRPPKDGEEDEDAYDG